MAPLQNAGSFLIQTVFDIYLLILLLRLIFQYFRADYYNPISQFIVKVTQPIIVPLRRYIPGYAGIDLATVLVIFAVTFLEIIFLVLINLHKFPGLLGLFIWSIGLVVGLTLKLFFYAILANAIITWIAPQSHSATTVLLHQLTEPLLRPFRRIIPLMGGFDITPIPVLIILQLLLIIVASPLKDIGFGLAIR